MKVSDIVQKLTGYGSRPKESESIETLVKLYKRQMIAKTVVMLLVLISLVVQLGFSKRPPSLTVPHVAVIKVHGAIGGENGVQGVDVIKAIKEAYNSPTAKGIMLDLNSGGGSPVQAEMVYEYLMSLRDKGKPIKAIVQEGCMSACYYIASAAESITAHRSSVVGSIGVRMDLWDFSEVKDRYGIGKKTLSAGTHKTILDSWSDNTMSEESIELVSKNAMNPLYESFVSDVKAARENINEVSYPNIYQGMFYSASKAKDAGLIDHVESLYFFKENFMDELDVTDSRIYEQRKKSFFETLGFPSISVNLNLPNSSVTS
nr:S49 family peptidase [Alteromonas macleodii]|tara:strand:+ start:772 stop:1722 length:951 start_codon:yes stop_codon:yes gene_type:complete